MTMTNSPSQRDPASFRDPAGFLFRRDGILYRQVNLSYQADYDLLNSSGLYSELTDKGWLVRHTEVEVEPEDPALASRIIQPELVDVISYPYEWSFSQLKDAALRTLAIQKRALKKGMSLKDASAYNIQFQHSKPVLIDTLSFETYQPGQPWVAYRQFCQHFLAPLALMAKRDVRLDQLLRVYIDGVPLDLASKLLPVATRFNLGLSTHLHLHASFQNKPAISGTGRPRQPAGTFSLSALEGLIESLKTTIRDLHWKPKGTQWGDYYAVNAGHYSDEASKHKLEIVDGFLERIQPRSVWDLGANTGVFSRLASRRGIHTVAFDIDPAAVEQNYLTCRANQETHLLPLVLDLTNPSPAIGWSNRERKSLLERGPAGAVLALALIHHLSISNNVPLPHLADFFHQAGSWLVIEFVPKEDSQAQVLLGSRQDIFPDYTRAGFEAAFVQYFTIHAAVPVRDTPRVLYLMEARAGE
jgi:ribosomal protein L11 methylase PrmA